MAKKDEMPPPSPLAAAVVFVDVELEGGQAATKSLEEVLRGLGAKVKSRFSRGLTHLVFQNGNRDRALKARQEGTAVVTLSWANACRQAAASLPEHKFLADLGVAPAQGGGVDDDDGDDDGPGGGKRRGAGSRANKKRKGGLEPAADLGDLASPSDPFFSSSQRTDWTAEPSRRFVTKRGRAGKTYGKRPTRSGTAARQGAASPSLSQGEEEESEDGSGTEEDEDSSLCREPDVGNGVDRGRGMAPQEEAAAEAGVAVAEKSEQKDHVEEPLPFRRRRRSSSSRQGPASVSSEKAKPASPPAASPPPTTPLPPSTRPESPPLSPESPPPLASPPGESPPPPRAGAQAAEAPAGAGASRRGGKRRAAPERWACARCSFENQALAVACDMCRSRKKVGAPPRDTARPRNAEAPPPKSAGDAKPAPGEVHGSGIGGVPEAPDMVVALSGFADGGERESLAAMVGALAAGKGQSRQGQRRVRLAQGAVGEGGGGGEEGGGRPGAVTHVVVAQQQPGGSKRTLRVVAGLLQGAHMVTPAFLLAALDAPPWPCEARFAATPPPPPSAASAAAAAASSSLGRFAEWGPEHAVRRRTLLRGHRVWVTEPLPAGDKGQQQQQAKALPSALAPPRDALRTLVALAGGAPAKSAREATLLLVPAAGPRKASQGSNGRDAVRSSRVPPTPTLTSAEFFDVIENRSSPSSVPPPPALEELAETAAAGGGCRGRSQVPNPTPRGASCRLA